MSSNGHNQNGNGRKNGNRNGHHPERLNRWQGIQRNYTPDDVEKLRPSIKVDYTLARLGSERLWELLNTEPYVNTFGALTGAQAVQMVRAGLKAIYLSGWQ